MTTIVDPPKAPTPTLGATGPTPSALDAVAVELAERTGADVDRLDVERRLPPDLERDAARAGLFRQLVPSSMGGVGSTPVRWWRRGVEMARRDPSFAWVVTQGAVELGWIAAGADPGWAAEVLADPTTTVASTTAGAGVLRVHGDTATFSGTWAFDTGSPGAAWLGGLAAVERPAVGSDSAGRPELRICWVPADRATILDDWDSTGLRGTGSHGITIPEQEIPMAWTLPWTERTPHDRGAHRSLVGNGNWPIAGAVAAVQLGIARRALDEARRIVQEKAPAPDFVPLARSAAVQRRLMELEGRWAGAAAAVEDRLTALWDAAQPDGDLSDATRVDAAVAHVAASRAAVEVVDGSCDLTGTAVAARRSPLSRCLRDVHTLAGHVAVGGPVLERAARVSLGLATPDLLL